jgi:3-hydroxyisobutyrate dehydrogenase-like beta-hydroxyacid dehydrogenase
MRIDRISVFGLGKVGATFVAALTAAGYRVAGVDVNELLCYNPSFIAQGDVMKGSPAAGLHPNWRG